MPCVETIFLKFSAVGKVYVGLKEGGKERYESSHGAGDRGKGGGAGGRERGEGRRRLKEYGNFELVRLESHF